MALLIVVVAIVLVALLLGPRYDRKHRAPWFDDAQLPPGPLPFPDLSLRRIVVS